MDNLDGEEYEYSSGWKKIARENDENKIKEEFNTQINLLQKELNKLKEEREKEAQNKNEGREPGPIDEEKLKTIDKALMEQNELKVQINQMKEQLEYLNRSFKDYQKSVDSQIQLLIDIVDFLKEKGQNPEKKSKGVLNGILSKR